jgi:hypothetical protein
MSFFPSEITGRKPGTGGSYVKGKWVKAEYEPFTIFGSVQSLNPKELESLPEGRRNSQAFKIYSDELPVALSEVDENNPAQILIFGQWYEVVSTAPFQNNLINHYKTIVSLNNKNSDRDVLPEPDNG